MSTLHFRRVERRRTDRVSVFVDLTVQGYTENNQKFKLQTRSLCVSGFGGLTILDANVVVGQTLVLTNENSRQKAECKIVSLRDGGDGKAIVAFEFVSPNPNFWKMCFPPAGAKPLRRTAPSPATAKVAIPSRRSTDLQARS
jgi:c-di-GMP-binding flagellar brake protein YcgR